MVAQNWQDLRAEEGNSSLDMRHKVSGTYLYELPFGQDKHWVTTGVGVAHSRGLFGLWQLHLRHRHAAHARYYAAAVAERGVRHGGHIAPQSRAGVSVTAGGGSLNQWFNTAAFQAPASEPSYPCGVFGNAPRNSIAGPGTIQNNMSLSKTMQLGDTRSMEIRATIDNVFNTVQYSGVDTNVASPTFGQVTSVGSDAIISIHGEIQILTAFKQAQDLACRLRELAEGKSDVGSDAKIGCALCRDCCLRCPAAAARARPGLRAERQRAGLHPRRRAASCSR